MANAPAADFTRLLNMCRMRLPGTLDAPIRYELFSVCDELFSRSNVWQEEIPVPVVADTTLYEIEPEENSTAKIVRLLYTQNSDEINIGATMAVIGELVLATAPTVADTYSAFVSLTVKDPVDENDFPKFPKWLLQRYREGLLDGVLGRMMSHVGKPYSNERMSIYHLRRFRNVMAQAAMDAQHQNVHGANAWQYPRGWR